MERRSARQRVIMVTALAEQGCAAGFRAESASQRELAATHRTISISKGDSRRETFEEAATT